MDTDDARGPLVAWVVVPEDVTRARFDRFATDNLPQYLPSRNRARKAGKAGILLLDGVQVESSRWIVPGQRVELYQGKVAAPRILEVPLIVVYEDEHLAVVVKPPGLLTNGNRHATLENALPANLKKCDVPGALPWPRPVHRLDRATGGLVAVAKAHGAQVWLGRAFEERKAHKRYRAIVSGRLEGTREVRTDVDGRTAWTTIVPVEHTPSLHTDWTTSVDLFPHTGRTHQLRVHCASLGHAIVGDTLYSEAKTLRGKGLFLWALGLRVEGPDGRVYDWSIDEPFKFVSYRARELRRHTRWHAENPSGEE